MAPIPSASSAHRADIEGLRALAVTPVILFHAHLFSPGGFVGVDVFFVISGYLITRIIQADLQRRRFTLGVFYSRRIRRIFPALFLMLAISAVLAFLLLLPKEFVSFGGSLLASAGFVSNMYFRSQIDYFDEASEFKPLLHVWSLAVEEQFYIFWPLILIVSNKKLQEKRKIFYCGVIFFISLFYSEYLVHQTPKAAFFLLPARAFELALGALLAMSAAVRGYWRTPKLAANLASIAGVALICWAIVFYDAHTPFPGLAALAPCGGAALVIGAGERGTTPGGRLLASPPFAFIGRISYSLYLWHWPILVFARLYLGRDLQLDEKCWALIATLAMAFFSWRFVEEPFRKARVAASDTRVWVGGGAAAIVMAVCAGLSIVAFEGFPGRVGAKIGEIEKVRAEAIAFQYSPCLARGASLPPLAGCLLGQPSQGLNFDVVLWGDSHAAQLEPAIETLGRRLNFTARAMTKAGCAPLPGVRFFPENEMRRECPQFNEAAMAALVARPPATIVVAGWWSVYATGEVLVSQSSTRPPLDESRRIFVASFKNMLVQLTRARHLVIVVAQAPTPNGNPVNCIERTLMTGRGAAECAATAASRAEVDKLVNALLRSATEGLEGVRIVFPFERVCDARDCPVLNAQGQYLYMDDAHLSAAGVELVTPAIEQGFAALGPRRRNGGD